MHTTTSPVAVVAEDSDVFQLLVHHADPAASNVYKLWSLKIELSALPLSSTEWMSSYQSLLFPHAISGCDTTSRSHWIGKVGVLKNYAALAESAATFLVSEFLKVALEKAGKRVLLIMNGSQVDDLTTARLQKFQTKVSTAAGYVQSEKLPPLSDPPRFHSHHRVFLEIQA